MLIKINALLTRLRENIAGMQVAESIALAGVGIAIVVALSIIITNEGTSTLNNQFDVLDTTIEGANGAGGAAGAGEGGGDGS